MPYRIAADLLVIVHFAFIVFVVVGGLAALKWRWVILLHIPAAVWAALIEFQGWICPLTPWEQELWRLGGRAPYEGGFVAHYILPVVYPDGLTRGIQVGLGVGVVVLNVLVYGWLVARATGRRHRRVE